MADLGRKQYYYHAGLTVASGAVDQQVAVLTSLYTAGRDPVTAAATYLTIATDVAVTVKINATTATEITVGTTDGFTLPGGVMSISNLYFSHTGASSGSGDATVEIFAS